MRIEQTHSFLLDLARSAGRGDLGVAAFQRPYVWTKADVEAYFASILKGWPTGSFLMWDTDSLEDAERLSRGRLGPIPTTPDAPHLLLDGQNRLATLAWATADGLSDGPTWSSAERSTWLDGSVLAIDVAERSLVFTEAESASRGLMLPFSQVARPLMGGRMDFEAIKALGDRGATNEDIDWVFDRLPNTIRSAKTVVTTISRATIDEAKEAFLSICRVGQPMTGEDFDRAMAWNVDQASSPGIRA